jgi:hypothetical protein
MSSPLVEQFRKGGVSRDVRLAAASGALPLKPVDQVELLYLLSRDIDSDVRDKAVASLTELPEETLSTVLRDQATHPKVIDFYSGRLESRTLIQAILQNPVTEDGTIAALAARCPTELLELVVINQTRLLRHPPIIEALESNAELASDQRRRLLELKHDFKLGAEPAPPPPAPAATPDVYVDLAAGPPELDELEAGVVLGDDLDLGDGDLLAEETKKERESLYKRLAAMTTVEKMMAALKEGREFRMALIRDRNRVVYSAVLASPQLTDAEVDAFAAMKNVSPEVLRTIGAKREWTKRYTVAHELVKNPLTPIEISMSLISRLAARDLKRICSDRNVPDAVRRQATKLTRAERR